MSETELRSLLVSLPPLSRDGLDSVPFVCFMADSWRAYHACLYVAGAVLIEVDEHGHPVRVYKRMDSR